MLKLKEDLKLKQMTVSIGRIVSLVRVGDQFLITREFNNHA